MSDSDSDASKSSEDEDYIPSAGEESEHEQDNGAQEEGEEVKTETEADKKKTDEVWESFKKETQNTSSKTDGESSGGKTKDSSTVTVTKVYDFAGEEVKVTKTVAANSIEAKTFASAKPQTKKADTTPLGRLKRSSGGIHSVLGKLGKKPKLSTLEKSKLDWQTFKQEKGIHEELDSYKKGKDGYLEKQSFLQRTDVRQFEKERDIRLSRNTSRR